jgi:transposase
MSTTKKTKKKTRVEAPTSRTKAIALGLGKKPDEACAKECGVTSLTISTWRRKFDLPSFKASRLEANDTRVEKLLAKGLTCAQIHAQIGMSRAHVYAVARRLGHTFQPVQKKYTDEQIIEAAKGAKSLREAAGRLNVNLSYFASMLKRRGLRGVVEIADGRTTRHQK